MRKSHDHPSRKIQRLFVRAQGGTATSFSLLSAAFLQGCSTFSPGHGQSSPSAGSDPSAPAVPSGPRDIRGVALNGYLDRAFVFQDLNRDGLYTINEPADLTNSRGEFTLSNAADGLIVVKPINQLTAPELQAAREPLLSRGLTSTEGILTTYRSSSGETVTFNGRLENLVSGTPSNVVVTPMTTFSAGLIAGGKSAEYAASKVQEIFGADPTTDYIATGNVALRSAATAASNLLSTTQNLLSGQDDALTVAWADALLSAYQQTSSQALDDIRLTELLASDRDLATIFTSVANKVGVELDLTQASELARQLALLNAVLDQRADTLELQNDTGLSQVDGITSDIRVKVPLALRGQSVEYAVVPVVSKHAESANSNALTWNSQLQIDTIADGYYDLYLRNAAEATVIFSRRVLFDRSAPLSREIPDYYEFSEPSAFVADRFALSTLSKSDHFIEFSKSLRDDEQAQFYISDHNESIADASASEHWINYINIADEWSSNGRDLYLFTRVVDLAGNYTLPTVQHYKLDNITPLTPDLPAGILQADTGIYENDNYSSRIELTSIASRLLERELSDDVRVMASINGASPVSLNQGLSLTEDGTYDVAIFQVDSAGNTSAPINKLLTLDSVAPTWANASLSIRSNSEDKSVLDFQKTETFNEWVQYAFVGTQNSATQSSWEWSNYIDPYSEKEGSLYVRWMDRGGNSSGSNLVQGYIYPTELVSIESTLDLGSIASASDLTARFQINQDNDLSLYSSAKFSSRLSNSLINITEYVVATSVDSAELGDSVGFDFLTDSTTRDQNSFAREDYFIKPRTDNATVFRSEGVGSTSVVIHGSSFSDLYDGILVGDIFRSGSGVDRAILGGGLSVSGIAFLSAAEVAEISTIVPTNSQGEIDRNLQLSQAYYRIYAESPGNEDAQGILITDAEIFQYGENSDQYIALVHNEKLGQWFFDFGASDDNVYFGGERSFVLGGSGSDRLLGGWGSDYLVAGSSGSDSETLMGYSGDDILIVGDYVTRSYTTFYLDGGDGDDVLILGNGSGIVVGGDGSDRFVVNPIIESDVNFNLVIQDFDYFTDKLVFSVPGLNDIQSGIFVNYSDSSVIFDITSILRSSAQDFWAENPLAQSILKLENLELSGVTVESILDTWIEFDTSSYSTAWTDLSSGWITYA